MEKNWRFRLIHRTDSGHGYEKRPRLEGVVLVGFGFGLGGFNVVEAGFFLLEALQDVVAASRGELVAGHRTIFLAFDDGDDIEVDVGLAGEAGDDGVGVLQSRDDDGLARFGG